MMFEHKKDQLATKRQFLSRLIWASVFALVILVVSLGVGMVGYRYLGRMSWIDAFLNASMILTGMGPVNPMVTNAAKLFSGMYAIFSGVAFLSMASVMLGPFFHRFLHWFHLDF